MIKMNIRHQITDYGNLNVFHQNRLQLAKDFNDKMIEVPVMQLLDPAKRDRLELLFASINTFNGNCEFEINNNFLVLENIPVLRFLLELLNLVNCVILDLNNEDENCLSYPPSPLKFKLKIINTNFQISVFECDELMFEESGDIIIFYKEVYNALGRVIHELYDKRPELAELKILQGQAHFEKIRQKWIKSHKGLMVS